MTDEPLITDSSTSSGQGAPEMVQKSQYLRLAADFDNYRKAMDAQIADVARYGTTNAIIAMLEVGDHLEQAVAHAPEAVREAAEWFRGLEQILTEFRRTMEKLGVTRIKTESAPFDPSAMEAVSSVNEDSAMSHTVKQEVRAGYQLNGRVIRPARVIIYE